LVPIETTCRGDHDAIAAPPIQFVSEPATTVVPVELFKLEEVGADGENGGSPVNQGKRNTSFRSQQTFRLDLNPRKERADLV
jgi:hypothetical protein